MEYTEPVVGLSHIMYALADTVRVWSPLLIFGLCCTIIALIGYLFDSYRDD